MHIAVRVRCADALDRVQDLLAELLLQRVWPLLPVLVVHEESLIGKRPRHIYLNLVPVRSWKLGIEGTEQGLVVSILHRY